MDESRGLETRENEIFRVSASGEVLALDELLSKVPAPDSMILSEVDSGAVG